MNEDVLEAVGAKRTRGHCENLTENMDRSRVVTQLAVGDSTERKKRKWQAKNNVSRLVTEE